MEARRNPPAQLFALRVPRSALCTLRSALCARGRRLNPAAERSTLQARVERAQSGTSGESLRGRGNCCRPTGRARRAPLYRPPIETMAFRFLLRAGLQRAAAGRAIIWAGGAKFNLLNHVWAARALSGGARLLRFVSMLTRRPELSLAGRLVGPEDLGARARVSAHSGRRPLFWARAARSASTSTSTSFSTSRRSGLLIWGQVSRPLAVRGGRGQIVCAACARLSHTSRRRTCATSSRPAAPPLPPPRPRRPPISPPGRPAEPLSRPKQCVANVD